MTEWTSNPQAAGSNPAGGATTTNAVEPRVASERLSAFPPGAAKGQQKSLLRPGGGTRRGSGVRRPRERRERLLRARWWRSLVAALIVVASLGARLGAASSSRAAGLPAWERDGGWLSKQRAQRDTAWAAESIAPILDPAAPPDRITVHVAAPSKCHRRDHATVLCWFSVHLVTRPVTRTGFMRIHLQADGQLGEKEPWFPLDVALVPPSTSAVVVPAAPSVG